MARNGKVKTPDPRENAAMYFKQHEGEEGIGIRCVAAALSLDSNTHVVICAPDSPALKRAWDKIATCPLDMEKSVVVLYKYLAEEAEGLPLPASDSNGKDVSNRYPDRNTYQWYYHPESDCCFIEFDDYEAGTVELLGPAERMTVNECKLLLRSRGWDRKEIDKLKISDVDPIPF